LEHPQKIHPCHPDYRKKIVKCITRMTGKGTTTKNTKKIKKRTGPRPTKNDGGKMTVKRKLLLTRQNKRLQESLQKGGWRKEGHQEKLKHTSKEE